MIRVFEKMKFSSEVLRVFLYVSFLHLSWMKAFGFGIAVQGKLRIYGQDIHERITKKAAFDSGLIQDHEYIEYTYSNDGTSPLERDLALKYITEGVRFNDDPEGYFMEGTSASNHGNPLIRFIFEFLGTNFGEIVNDPTKSSHFGSYQYLHAMGDSTISRNELRAKMIRYIYHCWKMATERDSFNNFKKDYEIVFSRLKLDGQSNQTSLLEHYTKDQLLVRNTIRLFPKEVLFFHATNQAQFQFRALGSIFHIIQDSFAKGHVVRVGWEEGDNSGVIRYFQNYLQQEASLHSHFDHFNSDQANEEAIFLIPGALAAYERTKQFMIMVKNRCPWTSTRRSTNSLCKQSIHRTLLSEIFGFSPIEEEESFETRSHPQLLREPNSAFENAYNH